MKSDDIRNDPMMREIMAKNQRHERMVSILTVGVVAVLAACLLAGCPGRWPVVIVRGGSGAGEAGPSDK